MAVSTEQNKAIIRRVFDEFVNQGDFSVVDEIYRPDIIDHEGLPGAPEGVEGVKYTIAGLRTAFPDLKVVIEDMSADGDHVVIHNTWHGTHLGELLGMEPTGRTIESTGIVVWRLDEGLIAERWAIGVASNMFAQLGMRMFAPGRTRRPARTTGTPVVRVVPVRPGKTEAWHRLNSELAGPRLREYEASRRRLGIGREVFRPLPGTGEGQVAVYFETDDPARTARRWANSEDPFDQWLRERIHDIHGTDPWLADQAAGDTAGHSWTAPPKLTRVGADG
ncbi:MULTISPECIES: ester cyclase [Streptomyces]|uniref:Ester cyclase n=1 Tax=Streptomyces eurythermus TaxID=42237 RepID=A0ABW6Z6Y5_9ACTN|nr:MULTISPECIES: ester cyclase [Streptomyces]QIS74057.1 ester cyclase [Streptomyces sp. DSM 40868]WDM16585.1 ester cyclase [Streptomyces lavenduligriseus]